MTQVISLLTPTGVLQASDRRLMWLQEDGAMRLRDDDRNKAVVFGNRLVFAYTGLAELGPRRQRTDGWLAQTLHDVRGSGDQADILDALAEAATDRLNHPLHRNRPARERGHEFVACGWARFPSSDMKEFAPYVAFVGNMRSSDNDHADPRRLAEPADRCDVVIRELPPGYDGVVFVSGQPIDDLEYATLRDALGQALPDLTRAGVVLVEQIRRTAARNDAVGRGVLLNSLPRGAIREGDHGVRLLMAGPVEHTLTCAYVPADEDEPRVYGPTLVAPSGGVISGLTGGPPGTAGLPRPTSP